MLTLLRTWGIPLEEKYIAQGDFRQERGYACAKELLALSDPPTAIFLISNLTSLGAVQYLQERRLILGKDIAVIGFDEVDSLQYAGIALSVIDRDTYRMGWNAVKLMARRLAATNFRPPLQEVFIPTKLILRGSEKFPS